MATFFTPADNTQFAQGLAYYFGESATLPGTWTAAQVGTFAGSPDTISTWDTTNVTDMTDAFNGNTYVTRSTFDRDISGWITSNVTNMNKMFNGNPVFNQNIGGWDTSNVTDMQNMFTDARDFNQNIGGWNTSNVKVMQSMFDCSTLGTGQVSAFNQDISSWNVAGVIDMQFMFRNSSVFVYDITVWKVSPTTNLSGMFKDAAAFLSTYGGLSGWADLAQGTPTSAFFNYVPPVPYALSFGGMPNKSPYTTNASFAMGRMLATRAYQSNPVPNKQFKTQNGGGTAGRLRRLKAQAAFGDVTRTVRTVVNAPTQPVQITATTTEPNFGGADPNIVNANLARARNIGAAVPRNAIPR